MKPEIKSYRGEVKSLGEDGAGKAVFATLNIVDKDGDITIPGAFTEQTVKLVGGHDWQKPNIGYAKIREEGDKAVADFQFYLDMPSAKEWYTAVKKNFEAGVPQEYSYGFHVTEDAMTKKDGHKIRELRKVDVFEVSFVMSGAGTGTETVELKCDSCAGKKEAPPEEDKATEEEPPVEDKETESKGYGSVYLEHGFKDSWENIQARICQAVKTYFNPDEGADAYIGLIATYDKKAYAFCEKWEKGVQDVRYYEVDWNESRSEVRITKSREVELKLLAEPIKNLGMDAEKTLVRSAFGAIKAVQTALAKEGRVLSTANRARLNALVESLDELGALREAVRGELGSLLDETDPDKGKEDETGKSDTQDISAVEIAEALSQAALAEADLALSA